MGPCSQKTSDARASSLNCCRSSDSSPRSSCIKHRSIKATGQSEAGGPSEKGPHHHSQFFSWGPVQVQYIDSCCTPENKQTAFESTAEPDRAKVFCSQAAHVPLSQQELRERAKRPRHAPPAGPTAAAASTSSTPSASLPSAPAPAASTRKAASQEGSYDYVKVWWILKALGRSGHSCISNGHVDCHVGACKACTCSTQMHAVQFLM